VISGGVTVDINLSNQKVSQEFKPVHLVAGQWSLAISCNHEPFIQQSSELAEYS
jgi:hypothetical protein